MPDRASSERRDLSLTALYTAGAWQAFGLPGSDLLASDEAARVFRVVNFALRIARFFRPGPVLRETLRHRHALIDHLVEQSEAPLVLELAAGLSPRGLWLSGRGREAVEVDLPDLMATKRRLLERSEAGRAALARTGLRLVSGDVFEVDFDALLSRPGPVCVVAEGLLVYLEPAARRTLYEKVARLLARRSGDFVFDLLPPAEEPPPGLVGQLLAWLMRRATGGADFDRTPETREAIRRALLEAGFTSVTTYEPATHPALVPRPDAPSQTLVWRATVRER
ncbi:MAG: hypothetical protein D6729_05440 [Deltaproteobacteria bacterium]|nr:MAG: hypothetical protein D6729_05440 [Deltaproteobacteria bacterium]